MRGSLAKKIRRKVYGDISLKVSRDTEPGKSLRKKYQKEKGR